jgi:membrane protease YdiL (CAAX protease family)
MSILLESTPPQPFQWAILYVLAAIGFAVAGLLGLFRGASVYGGRMSLYPRLVPLAAPFLIGAVTFFLSQVLYLAYVQAARGNPGEPFNPSLLVLSDWLVLATAPFVAAMAAMSLANAFIPGAGLKKLGLRPVLILPGLLCGVAGILIAAPIVFWFSAVSEWFYRKIDYVHPMEHDLLRALPEASAGQTILLLIGIMVCAPVMEEILFRGHLQTLLRRLLGGRRIEPTEPSPPGMPASPVDQPIDGTATPILDYTVPQPPPWTPIDRSTSPWTAWVAILVTSMVFAVIHPIWSAPPIFLLSIALGFAYERTGNLWTPIFMHALFNASSTALFVLTQGSR